MTFSMKCSCGDEMKVEAGSRDEAATKLKATMTQDAINAHFTEKHAGQAPAAMADVHAMIDKDLAAVA